MTFYPDKIQKKKFDLKKFYLVFKFFLKSQISTVGSLFEPWIRDIYSKKLLHLFLLLMYLYKYIYIYIERVGDIYKLRNYLIIS